MSGPSPDQPPYAGRGGLKLRHALTEFGIDPSGLVCADFGANVGGFTDCLLRAGAARVYAVDTGYGALAWKLRQNPRVVVMERTNALHAPPPGEESHRVGIDLLAIDLGWTPQRLALPAATAWLAPRGSIITLIKPHYELDASEKSLLDRGVLEEREAERIAHRTVERVKGMGFEVLGLTRSPILGGAGKGNKRGNAEWLAWVRSATLGAGSTH
jgi:23S rRNA (cytidine1920-2'-O)/16S rRNA (cytidine1409-2'-O)-methyltransferase